jgi:hypothetical protein
MTADKDEIEFREERVIRFILRAVSDNPLIDELDILISEKVENPQMIKSLYHASTGKFKHMAQLSLREISPRTYRIKIVSGQYRGTWINSFKAYVKQQMKVKIQDWGGSDPFRKGSSPWGRNQGKKRGRILKGLEDAGLI